MNQDLQNNFVVALENKYAGVTYENCNYYQVAIVSALKRKNEIAGFIKSLISDYKDNPAAISEMLGRSATDLLIQIITTDADE